jgi:hypothetical protein
MSINIPDFFVKSFSSNVEHLLQQQDSRLYDAVMHGSYVGQSAQVVNQFGQVAMQPVVSRFTPKVRTDVATDQRWVYPASYDLNQSVDNFDKLKIIIADPLSQEAQAARNAVNRQKDNNIIAAFFGTAKTGIEGGTSTTFGTTVTTTAGGRNVAVSTGGATSSLNVAKLREARRALTSFNNDMDSDPMYIAVTSKEQDALLGEIQVTSLDFNDSPVLKDGKITRFLGFNFIQTELLTTGTDDAAGTSNQIPAWMKSGMHCGIWNDINNDIHQRHDLVGDPWEISTTITLGSTRTQENKIIRIWCR